MEAAGLSIQKCPQAELQQAHSSITATSAFSQSEPFIRRLFLGDEGYAADLSLVFLFFGTGFERYFGMLGKFVGTASGSRTGLLRSKRTSSPCLTCSKCRDTNCWSKCSSHTAGFQFSGLTALGIFRCHQRMERQKATVFFRRTCTPGCTRKQSSGFAAGSSRKLDSKQRNADLHRRNSFKALQNLSVSN